MHKWNPLVLLCWGLYTFSTWGSYHLRLLNLIWGRIVLPHLKIIALTDMGANATKAEAEARGLSLCSGVHELKSHKNVTCLMTGVVCIHVSGTGKSDLTLRCCQKGFASLFPPISHLQPCALQSLCGGVGAYLIPQWVSSYPSRVWNGFSCSLFYSSRLVNRTDFRLETGFVCTLCHLCIVFYFVTSLERSRGVRYQMCAITTKY